MPKRMPTHINFGIIARRKGQSARVRQAYQMCGETVTILGKHLDFTSHRRQHVHTAILLPPGASEQLLDPEEFISALEAAETRVDAQECRTLDFDLPRDLSLSVMPAVAAFVLAPLVRAGMATQIDIECPRASDGGDHPHVHAILAMRMLEGGSFGPKNREWNKLFSKERGRWMRRLIAARLTMAASFCGLDLVADPRTARDMGAATPLPRLPRGCFRDNGSARQQIEELRVHWRAKHLTSVQIVEPEPTPALNAQAVSLRPFLSGASSRPGHREARKLPERHLVAAWEAATVIITTADGQTRRSDANLVEASGFVAACATELDEPSLIAEGPAHLVEAIARAAVGLETPVAIMLPTGDRAWPLFRIDEGLRLLTRSVLDLTGAEHVEAWAEELQPTFLAAEDALKLNPTGTEPRDQTMWQSDDGDPDVCSSGAPASNPSKAALKALADSIEIEDAPMPARKSSSVGLPAPRIQYYVAEQQQRFAMRANNLRPKENIRNGPLGDLDNEKNSPTIGRSGEDGG